MKNKKIINLRLNLFIIIMKDRSLLHHNKLTKIMKINNTKHPPHKYQIFNIKLVVFQKEVKHIKN